MRINKWIVIFAFLLIIFCQSLSPPQQENVAYAQPMPDTKPRPWDKMTSSDGSFRSSYISNEAAILMDANTGQVLFEKHADTPLYPASITKIMTCVLVLEHTEMSDLVTVGHVGDLEDGAKRIGVHKDELLSVEDLLYGLMLHSGNDAGVVLAKHISGSVEKFGELMTEKAREIGMMNTTFKNPHGLHESGHRTTARDMAILTQYARKNHPEFVKIVSTYKYTCFPTNKHTEPRHWFNSNRLITPNDAYFYDYATGAKTGYTKAALHTFVGTAEKGDQALIAVVLRCKDGLAKWDDSIDLFEYGFTFYDTIKLSKLLAEDELIAEVNNAATPSTIDKLKIIMRPDVQTYLTDKSDVIEALRTNPDRFERQIDMPETLSAPIEKDQELGTVKFLLDGAEVLSCTLVAAHNVEELPTVTPEPSPTPRATLTPQESKVTDEKKGIPGIILYGGGGLVALVIVLTVVLAARRRTRYRQYDQSLTSSRSRSNDGPKHGSSRGRRRRY